MLIYSRFLLYIIESSGSTKEMEKNLANLNKDLPRPGKYISLISCAIAATSQRLGIRCLSRA